MKTFYSAILFAATGFTSVEAQNGVPSEPLSINVFTQGPQLSPPKISPDGNSIAMEMIVNEENLLVIGQREGVEFSYQAISAVPEDMNISNIRWVTSDRLLYTLSYWAKVKGTKYKLPASTLMATDKDGSNSILLRTDGGKKGKSLKHLNNADVIHILPDDPNHILVGRSRNRNWIQSYYRGELSDVYKINVHTGEMVLLMKAPKIEKARMRDWYADPVGNVRFGYGETRKGDTIMAIRGKNTQEWNVLSNNELFEEGKFSPLMFGKGENEFYVLSSLASGRNTVFSFDIETGELVEKVFEHDEVDIDRIVYSHEKGKVLSAIYYDDSKQEHFFDDDYKRAQITMERALKAEVSSISNSKDENHKIIQSWDATDPGAYYYYNVEGRAMHLIGMPYPLVDPSQMGKTTAIEYQTRDGLTIDAYLTVPNWHTEGPRPAIIMPLNGGRYHNSYDYRVQFYVSRGYIVLRPNVRGASGYGDRFASLGRGEWGRDKHNDIQDAVYWLEDEGYVEEGKTCISGMGRYAGYEAIMGSIISKDVFACAISFGGHTDIERMLKDAGSFDTDEGFYNRVAGSLEKKEVGQISPVQRASEVGIPLLLLHGDSDSRVDAKYPTILSKALTKAKIPHEYHEFEEVGASLEYGSERRAYFEKIEAFLKKHNPTAEMKKWKQ